MEDEFGNALKLMADVLGQAQAINQANSYILMELVRDIAGAQPDPARYLKNMFERVSARADQGPIEKEAHPVAGEFRLTVERFFFLAGKNL